MKPQVGALALLLLTPSTAVLASSLLQHGALPYGQNCATVNPQTSVLQNGPCSGAANQLFEQTNRNELRTYSGNCLEFFGDGSVKSVACVAGNTNQNWRFNFDGSIATAGYEYGKCLGATADASDAIKLQPCEHRSGATSPAQTFRLAFFQPERADVMETPGSPPTCIDFAYGTTFIPFACHGKFNQLYEYSLDDELRTGDVCMTQGGTAVAPTVVSAKCGNGAVLQQKWAVHADMAGHLQSQSLPALCLDMGVSPVALAPCSLFNSKQVFPTARLLAARSRNIKRSVIQTPTLPSTCVTVDRASANVIAAPCQTVLLDFWWEYTTASTLQLPGNKCLDMSLTQTARVIIFDCNKQLNQQWDYDAANGVFTNRYPGAVGLCLTFANATAPTARTFSMTPCTPATRAPNQFFSMREFTMLFPPTNEAQQLDFCNAGASKQRDLAFLRDTLALGVYDFKYLVPSSLSGNEAVAAYYDGVVLATIARLLAGSSADTATALPYKRFREDDVVALLRTVPGGVDALLDLGQLLCVSWGSSFTGLQRLLTDLFRLNSGAFSSTASFGGIVDYLSVAGFTLVANTPLPPASPVTSALSAPVGDAINKYVNALVTARKYSELETFLALPEVATLATAAARVCGATHPLSVCGVALYRSLWVARQSLQSSIKDANATGLVTNEYVTEAVQNNAAAMVAAYRSGAAASKAVDVNLWAQYAQYCVFGESRPAEIKYTRREMDASWESMRVVVPLVAWSAFTSAELSSRQSNWLPLYSQLDKNLTIARRNTVETTVYEVPVRYLEAYMAGVTSDMGILGGEVLPRVCKVQPTASVCDLLAYYRLTVMRSELARVLKRDVPTVGWSEEIDGLAGNWTALFAVGAQSGDVLWRAMGARLTFDSVRLQLLPNTLALRTTARPASFLLAYAVFSRYGPGLSSLLPFFTFLVDQVSVSHFNGVTALTDARDVDAMALYIAPASNATLSDLGVLGGIVLPRVCNNPNNPVFSVCKLQEFYVGLQQIIAFERRRKSRTIVLTDLADVDVRKQLEVVDSEKTQFDIITTIQESANQIGQTIVDESNKIQGEVKLAAASLEQSLKQKTDALRVQIQEEGQRAQAAIEASTNFLVDTIGQATDLIRDEIESNTQALSRQMSAEAKETQRQLQLAKQQLSTQIGQEAAATRRQISALDTKLTTQLDKVGNEIKGKIDASTKTLYAKIGQEGQATRQAVQTSTDTLFRKIGSEAESVRGAIRESTRELTTVINTNTAKLSDKIDASTSQVTSFVGGQFKNLGTFFQSEATVSLSTLLAQFQQSDNAASELNEKLGPQVDEMVTALTILAPFASVAQAGAVAFHLGQATLNGGKALQDSAKALWVGSWLTGSADAVGSLLSATEAVKSAQQASNAVQNGVILVEKIAKFVNSIDTYKEKMTQLKAASGTMKSLAAGIRKLGKGSTLSNAEAQKTIDELLASYNKFSNPIDSSTVDGLATSMQGILGALNDAVLNSPAGAVAGAVLAASRARSSLPPVFASLSQLCEELDAQFALVGSAVSAANKYEIAKQLGTRRRSLQAGGGTSVFKPFFAMADVKLSKLFMDYRIQVAAHQFCSFYEFTMGGARPPMCTAATYYSRTDIQRMKAFVFTPPVATPVVAFLPTRPTPIGDGTASSEIALRPYLDLDRLLKGESVTVTLPVGDAPWLKKYGWVPRTDSVMPSVFLDSMQIVLPFTRTNATMSSEPFDIVVDVEIQPTQRLGSQSAAAFVMPPTNLRFASAIDTSRLCPFAIPNPYHAAAKCVEDDDTSRLCVSDRGDVVRKTLLPSLFSTWVISSPRQFIDQPGKGYKLALPADGVDLNVIVNLMVRRIAGSTSNSKPANLSPLAGPGCCADDEYLKSNVCVKCPAGSTGALNGYSCQRV